MDKEKEIYYKTAMLFKKLGIRNISMDDIAKELRVSKKTLYQYVKNKHEIIDKAFAVHTEIDCTYFSEIGIKEHLNALDILLQVSKYVIEGHRNVNPAFLFDAQKYYPEILKKYWDIELGVIREKLICNINRGIEEGLFRSEINKNLIVDLYLEKLTSINQICDSLSADYSFEEIITALMENHIRSIANESGLRYYEDHRVKKE